MRARSDISRAPLPERRLHSSSRCQTVLRIFLDAFLCMATYGLDLNVGFF